MQHTAHPRVEQRRDGRNLGPRYSAPYTVRLARSGLAMVVYG